MEFKNRNSTYPGRVKLVKDASASDDNTYYLTLVDNPSVAGTPLNKATFDDFKNYLLDVIANNPGAQGPQGEKGDKGDKGDRGEVGTTTTGTITIYYKSSSSYSGTYSSTISATLNTVSVSGRVYNFIKFTKNLSADTWVRISLPNAKHISCLPIKNSTSGYTPGMICYSDTSYTYIGLDENDLNGAYICIIQ